MELLVIISLVLSAAIIFMLIALLRRSPADIGESVNQAVREDLRLGRDESAKASRELREEISKSHRSSTESLVTTMSKIGETQTKTLESVTSEIKQLTSSNETRLDKLRETVDEKLRQMQESNEDKLEQMRKTVDEKLHETLEKRLGESFKLVSQQLEAVQKGLGEMQSLATGVGDLKKVLSNVKARGTLGEIQLGAILEEIFTVDQYGKNIQTKEGSREHVEYAVRLPGPADAPDSCVWLPIDSKFPQEDYQRLVDAADRGDAEVVKVAIASLVRTIKASAKEVQDKYLNPPKTTDFAIMFLPTEGLYAEVLRQPGLVDELMRKFRVVVAGPTTLAAILNSLRMGFRTLAIEKRSSEVWQILAAVKTEFGKFGAVLGKLKNQLNTATRTVEETSKRTRAMERKLREVEQLPELESSEILKLTDSTTTEVKVIDDDI